MFNLREIMCYFCQNYPYRDELSNSRLTKLVYLSDWFSCLLYGKQLTEIRWVFNHYGPYVDDIIDTARQDRLFVISNSQNFYGDNKLIISCDENYQPMISIKEKNIIDFVIEKTKSMYFNEFIDYVYSTYPISSQQRYLNLDLVSLAREYKSTLQ
jgi:hypothetical protein